MLNGTGAGAGRGPGNVQPSLQTPLDLPINNFNIKEPGRRSRRLLELPEHAQHQAPTKCHTWSIRAFSHLKVLSKVWTKIHIFVKLYTFDPVTFGFTLQFCEHTKELWMIYVPHCHHLCGLCLPIFDIDWFVDRGASDIGMLSIWQIVFSVWMEKMNEQIHFFATILLLWYYYQQHQLQVQYSRIVRIHQMNVVVM